MTRDVRQVLELITLFVSGKNQSRNLADRIESLVIEGFTNEAWFDDVSLALAQFAPHGGAEYYDELALSQILKPVADQLRIEIDSQKGTQPPSA